MQNAPVEVDVSPPWSPLAGSTSRTSMPRCALPPPSTTRPQTSPLYASSISSTVLSPSFATTVPSPQLPSASYAHNERSPGGTPAQRYEPSLDVYCNGPQPHATTALIAGAPCSVTCPLTVASNSTSIATSTFAAAT